MAAGEGIAAVGVRLERSHFFWVWTKAGHIPSRFHKTLPEAEREAIRLALKHPDRKFIVLQALGKFGAVPPPEPEPVTEPLWMAV